MRPLLQLVILCTLLACGPEPELLPAQFYGLALQKKLEGDEARQFVNNMHFQQVTTTRNEIGFYEGEKGKVILYITHYPEAEQALEDERKMTQKISPENSVFIQGQHLDIDGKQVYRCFGMGQTHFVFSHGEQLFWISVTTTISNDFLKSYLTHLDA